MQDRVRGEPLPPAEPRYRRVLITWLAICPLVTTVLAAGEPLGLGDLPLIARSVVITAIVVPLAVLWVIPALRRAFSSMPGALKSLHGRTRSRAIEPFAPIRTQEGDNDGPRPHPPPLHRAAGRARQRLPRGDA